MKFPRCNVLSQKCFLETKRKNSSEVILLQQRNFFFFFFFNLCAIYWDFPSYKHSSGPGFSEVLHIKNLSLFLI